MKPRSQTERVIYTKKRRSDSSPTLVREKQTISSLKEKIVELQNDNEKLSEACISLMEVKSSLLGKLDSTSEDCTEKEKIVDSLRSEIVVLKADQFIQAKLQRQLEKQYQESVLHYTQLFQQYKKLQQDFINIQKVDKKKGKRKGSMLRGLFGMNNLSVSEDGMGGLSEALPPSLLLSGPSSSIDKGLTHPASMGWECYPFKNVRKWDKNDILNFFRDAGIFKTYYQKVNKYKVKNLARLFSLLGEEGDVSNSSQRRVISGTFEDFEEELQLDEEETEGEDEEEEEELGEKKNEEQQESQEEKKKKNPKKKMKKRSKYSLPLEAKDFFGKPIPRVQSRLFLINIVYLQDIFNQDELFDSKFPKTLYKMSSLPDFLTIPMEDIQKAVRRLINKSVIQESLMLQESESKIPVKLIMLEESSFHHEIKIEEVPIMEFQGIIPTRLTSPPYVTGLILGKWVLAFGGEKTGLVVPRKLRAGDDVLREATVLSLGYVSRRELRERIVQICDHVVEYSANLTYHRTERNCQHFVSDVLKELKISTNHLSGQIRDYLKFMKKNGRDTNLPLQFRPVVEWSSQDCQAWLDLLGLGKLFSSKFEELKVTGKELVSYLPKLTDRTSLNEGIFGVVPEKKSNKKSHVEETNIMIKKLRVHIMHYQQYYGKTRKALCYNPGMGVIVDKIMESDTSLDMPLSQIQKHAVVLSHPALLAKTYLPIKNLIDDVQRSKCLKVKMIITEIQGRPLSEVVNQIISQFLVKVRYFKDNDFGMFHSAVLIGNWYLEWTDTQLVIPKKLQSGGAFFLLDLAPIPFHCEDSAGDGGGVMPRKKVERRLKEIRKKVLEVIHKWNTKIHYSRSKHNCQHFVDDILGVLGVERNIDKNSCVGRYVNSIRKKGVANVYFEPDQTFINFFGGKKSNEHIGSIQEKQQQNNDQEQQQKIKEEDDDEYYGLKPGKKTTKKFKKSMVKNKSTFSTHSDLDEYFHNLLCFPGMSMVRFSSKFESEYQLLKSFDRAFWLRMRKFPTSNRYKPSKKNCVYGTGAFRCGCPFHSPFESKSFQGNKVLYDELRSYREEEEMRWKKEHPTKINAKTQKKEEEEED